MTGKTYESNHVGRIQKPETGVSTAPDHRSCEHDEAENVEQVEEDLFVGVCSECGVELQSEIDREYFEDTGEPVIIGWVRA